MNKTTDFITGLTFSEDPRIYNGYLWFSDFFSKQVLKADMDTGEVETVCRLDDQPSGLGWLPDGRMLVVSMLNRKVYRLETNGELTEYADLNHIATYHCNDMLVDKAGRAYVGNFGGNLSAIAKKYGREALKNMELPTAAIACIEPNGDVKVVAENMLFPNGTVLTDNGKTMIIAETYGNCLTAFDVEKDGTLVNRRTWAQFDNIYPDGICIDSEGAIWASNPIENAVYRVKEGGEITDKVQTSQNCYAVALGGKEGRTLYCCTAQTSDPVDAVHLKCGKIETIEVKVPALNV
ncbi:SMP-30/gluconolactonase/LRE family protein [Neobacillus rhizophilus]|uniref:SMP-30/gluconolactonase/LRE family protein n=1 Tax=Neobacillus rhizophilus TaxID=2833579 RepID=A0A942YW14_9BACI|nr:SMP-30/gluconolactonase/LRE family protein [Neobacillus rhizophilus]MBS4214634.1 SMP-30/gluconolactonase/LRE family protein [Neobacillus rhizophilus]